mgnify:FL=1|tara:strand:- start:579 stop:854 length:276 start_codon:yes stop_codon:yes gene_type:complete
MDIGDFLLSPRRDHRGWDTPSEASRILLLVTLLAVSLWAWPIAEGMIFVWLAMVLLVSTPILSLGWWLLSFAGQSRESRDLTPAVSRGDSS